MTLNERDGSLFVSEIPLEFADEISANFCEYLVTEGIEPRYTIRMVSREIFPLGLHLTSSQQAPDPSIDNPYSKPLKNRYLDLPQSIILAAGPAGGEFDNFAKHGLSRNNGRLVYGTNFISHVDAELIEAAVEQRAYALLYEAWEHGHFDRYHKITKPWLKAQVTDKFWIKGAVPDKPGYMDDYIELEEKVKMYVEHQARNI